MILPPAMVIVALIVYAQAIDLIKLNAGPQNPNAYCELLGFAEIAIYGSLGGLWGFEPLVS